MIYHLSLAEGGLWYLKPGLFNDANKYREHLESLTSEFNRSQEIFIKGIFYNQKQVDAKVFRLQ